jgi:IS605 OrfB family transposase
MRRFSSALRFAYQRLLEGKEESEVLKELTFLFSLNSRYAYGALVEAKMTIASMKELGQSPKKVIFGGKKLFEELSKKHLSGKRRDKLLEKWRERRQGLLFAVGQKHAKGNQNLRLVWVDGCLYFRITIGEKKWVYAKVIRKVKRDRDKWKVLLARLMRAEATRDWFPYTVTLRRKEGKLYAFISFEEELPPVSITKTQGVIGLDLNAVPQHVAWAEASSDGNLVSHGALPIPDLSGKPKKVRDYILWLTAWQIVRLAKEKGKAIALERLRHVPKGERGDGKPKLRRKLGNWAYRSLSEKVKILAQREGIEVVEVSPAYTSVIGALKYAPQYLLDKDRAAALVIARRALRFEEKMPKHYERLLGDGEFLGYAIAYWEEQVEELRARKRGEKNKWKGNAVRGSLEKAKKSLQLLKESVGGEPVGATCWVAPAQETADRWKEPVRGGPLSPQKVWQVAYAALAEPLLGRSFRDLSPLRAVLVLGDWERPARRLAPDLVQGRDYQHYRGRTRKVEAYDEKEKVGEGLHRRVIIDLEQFASRVLSKGGTL